MFLRILALLAIQVLTLVLLGRRWWCELGDTSPIIGDAWSSHTSQHLLDPYSLSHFQHGLFFFWALRLTWRPSLVLAVALEMLWEIAENTPFVINRYRTVTASLGYQGDSILNSIGDTVMCALGFILATKIGVRSVLLLFAFIEVTMLALYKDSLLINVIMLVYPLDAIKTWQGS